MLFEQNITSNVTRKHETLILKNFTFTLRNKPSHTHTYWHVIDTYLRTPTLGIEMTSEQPPAPNIHKIVHQCYEFWVF